MSDLAPDRAVIIDDDADLRNLTAEILQQIGYETDVAADGESGAAMAIELNPSLVCVDIQMPGIDGFETIRRIRESSDALIVMLTGKNEEMDVVQALGMGANDYFVKPIRPREFRSRIDALRRRMPPRAHQSLSTRPSDEATSDSHEIDQHHSDLHVSAATTATAVATKPRTELTAVDDEWLEVNDLRLNPLSRTVTVAGEAVALTRTEFDLLYALMQTGRRVRSKADLALQLRGDSYVTNYFITDSDKRAVEVHITNLRRKIGDQSSQPRWIETVRGVGYRMMA